MAIPPAVRKTRIMRSLNAILFTPLGLAVCSIMLYQRWICKKKIGNINLFKRFQKE